MYLNIYVDIIDSGGQIKFKTAPNIALINKII